MGGAVAERLAEEGASLVLSDISSERLEGFAQKIREQTGATVFSLRADVTTEEECDAVADLALAELGGIDVLVNIVGGYSTRHGPDGSILDMSEARWDETMNLNLKPNIFLMKKLVPGMIERDYGRIVNISSVNMQGYGAGRGVTPDYDAAKAAVASFTRSCVSPSPLHPQSGEARCPPAANPCRSLAAAGPRLCALQHERARQRHRARADPDPRRREPRQGGL